MCIAAISPQTPRFQDILEGPNAFYAQKDYPITLNREFADRTLPLPLLRYSMDTENKIARIAKQILSILCFPIALYHILHILAGKAIVPGSFRSTPQVHLSPKSEMKYKRLSLNVDGNRIDVTIAGTPSTLTNGRWMLVSGGNGECYEDYVAGFEEGFAYGACQLTEALKTNMIFFNYTGVGRSAPFPRRAATANAYRAVLSFLEDKHLGIGAKEIIGFGHSLGGGIQADALQTHVLKKDIRYVFVKSKTFSSLEDEVSALFGRVMGKLICLLGWNINTTASSRRLTAPEIIIQGTNGTKYEQLSQWSPTDGDGVIADSAALAKALLEGRTGTENKKIFLGVPEGHNDPLSDPLYLANIIKEQLTASHRSSL